MFTFVKDTLSEANGTRSFARVSAAAIIAFTLFWVTYLVLRTNAMPDLAGPTLFMSSGSSATYGANKLADAIAKKRTGEAAGDPPDKQ